jgi:hypothetical protein
MASRPGRVTGKAARRNKWYSKRRNQWIGGGVVLAVLGVGGVSIALDDSSSSVTAEESEGDKWRNAIVADFGTMSQSALNYLRSINDWRTGKADETEIDTAAGLALDQFLYTRDLLAARAPFEQAPRALTNYRDSVEVYIAHARLAKLGAQITDDDKLQRQVQLTMGRLRYVADRLYDLGSDEMVPFTNQDQEVAGFDYERAVDVPSFAGTDLAPGPPLTIAKPGAAAERRYEKSRPEEPFATWQAAVEAANIPTVEAEAKAIKDAGIDELDDLADQLTAASDKLHAAPDPMDERELSTRVQLGLLVQSEAMRAAQLSRLVDGKLRPEAVEITKVLALIGNRMWDDARLGVRDIGYPPSLLTVRPAVAPPPLDAPLPSGAPAPSSAPEASPSADPATPAAEPITEPVTEPTPG